MSTPIGTPAGTSNEPSGGGSRPGAGPFELPLPGIALARVYELEDARRRRHPQLRPLAGDRIPDEVWDEVTAAAQLFDRLHAEGRRVVFDTDRLSGRVVASVFDSEGGQHVLPLADAVDPASSRPKPGGGRASM